jgi:hypothetical protein
MHKIIVFLNITCLIIFLSSCSKKHPETGLKRLTYIETFRFGKEEITVEDCIKYGIIARDMTIDECNNSINGELKLKIKLEDNWAIYSHDGLNIFFNNKIAKSKEDLQKDRLIKTMKIIKKSEEQRYIEIHTNPPRT